MAWSQYYLIAILRFEDALLALGSRFTVRHDTIVGISLEIIRIDWMIFLIFNLFYDKLAGSIW